MNYWVAIGRLTDNVELRYTTGDNKMAVGTFNLAVDDGYGERKRTSFFKCTAFGKTAESLEKYAEKGVKIAVEGRPQQDTWKDKEGKNRSSVGFIITSWEFAQSKASKAADQAEDENGFAPAADDDDLPFH